MSNSICKKCDIDQPFRFFFGSTTTRSNVLLQINEMARHSKKISRAFCINDHTEVENLFRILLSKINGFCQINIHQDYYIIKYSDIYLSKPINIDQSEYINIKDIYLYCSKRSIDLYFEYISVIKILKIIVDTSEKKQKRLHEIKCVWLEISFSKHYIISNIDIFRYIKSFIC